MKLKIIYAILGILLLLIIGFVIVGPPINQDNAYHLFSKEKSYFEIRNFWNVTSNLIFIVVGCYGLFSLRHERFKIILMVFYSGVLLVSAGSAFYHYSPSNATLIWDRIPMTIAFMSLLALVVAEFHYVKWAKYLFIPFVLIGVYSVVHWYLFDDLKPYIAVQFFPILFILISITLFRSKGSTRPYWALTIAYFVAKLFEHFDAPIGDMLLSVGGHPFKHLSVGIGIFLFTYLRSDQFNKLEN